ncbi:efflux RND transporter permease subunit [Litoribrevibacter albus]|uniref:Multidrug transporter AcrB n=1 Tax=Litoribrevibacter albus TaxID=1473156 RepID=A0AA37SDV3_9GAMM|nr:efflux RND transporter permease subunit [Litoribrevibacter albus]GLQ32658.1 multidrug transporter AcrB [Litoribrevibacter albus]
MRLPALAINNHQFVWVATLILTLLGIVSYNSMPRSEDPQFNFPSSLITVIYSGTNPFDMESQIVDKIEEALNELDDIDDVKSTIRDSVSTTRIQFLYGADPDDKYEEVVRAVNQIRDQLPDGIQKLEIKRISPTDVNIVQLALSSESASYLELKQYAENLEDQLEKIRNVKESETWAYPEQQVEIALDLRKLATLGISSNQVLDVLSGNSRNIPAGFIYSGTDRLTVRTSGLYRTLEEIGRTPIYSRDYQVLHLEDIATIRLADATPRHIARYDGKRSVFISAVQREGSQIFDVMNQIRQQVSAFEATLPDTVQLTWVFDQSESVDRQTNSFFSSLLQGIAVVGGVLFLILGIRPAVVAMVSIPLSIVIAIGWVDTAGFGIQQMTIVGLIVALGLLVDNAIVVVENIQRFLKEGYSRLDATLKGASQVGWAITSGTVTTVLAFLPLLLLQSGSGTFMRSMPVTVVITLLCSLLLALTIVPLMGKYLLSHKIGPIATTSNRGFDWLNQRIYEPTLRFSLKYPWLVLLLCIGLFIGSLSVMKSVGVSMFPKADKPQVLVDIKMPVNASIEHSDAITRKVEHVINKHPKVTHVATNVGNGNPRIYYNKIPKQGLPNYAQLMVELDANSIQETSAITEELRALLVNWPEADIKVEQFQTGPPYEAPIAIRVISDKHGSIRQMAEQVEATMRGMEGIINIENAASDEMITTKIQIKSDKAALLGINAYEMDQAVRTALNGANIGVFRDNLGEDYAIVLKSNHYNHPNSKEFDRIMLTSASGAQIPLRQVADIQLESNQAKLQHYNLQRMTYITADVAEGYNVAAVTQDVIQQLNQLDWPADVTWNAGGEEENRNKNFAGLAKALVLSLLGIFAVLVLQFRSFLQPVIIFIAIPFAITGAILGLYVSGYSFSIVAFVGLNSLMGIVVNNSIILVDYANQLRAQGASIQEAISESSATRLMPIVLTTLTTVGGLLPLTIQGGVLWAPLGWTIIGGLAVSTLLTLILVPVLYKLLTRD